jgi:hypothetical protein
MKTLPTVSQLTLCVITLATVLPIAGRAIEPELVMPGAIATDYVIQSPRIDYLYRPGCAPIRSPEPEGPQATRAVPALAVSDRNRDEFIAGNVRQVVGRTAVTGMEEREIYRAFHDTFCTAPDTPAILSNIASDGSHVYWVSDVEGGLVRVPITRMVWQSTPPELVSAFTPRSAEIIAAGNFIYVLETGFTGTGLYRIEKSTGTRTPLLNGSQVGSSPSMLTANGPYLLWRYGPSSRTLKRYALSTGVHNDIASGVFGFAPSERGFGVDIGFENVIRTYVHATGSLSSPLYTSPVSATIVDLVDVASAEDSALYFIQRNSGTGGYALYRKTFGLGGTTEAIFVPPLGSGTLRELRYDDNWLFFLHDNELKRLPGNADAVEFTNLRIEGLEVTQAIQNDANVIPLVRGKRTVVRLFASSDGDSVPGVQARLYRVNGAGTIVSPPLLPINLERAALFLRVQSAPDRSNINDSFTFFLPPDWVSGSTLRIRAELNPFRFPPEPTYADNAVTTATFDLDESRRLETHFVLFEYDSGGRRARPRFREDYLQTVSWVRRTYPLASSPGGPGDESGGFRTDARRIFDEALGGNVDGTDRDPDCQRRINLEEDEDGYLDDPSLCAAWYVVCPTLATIRAAEELPNEVFQVGMVPDDGGFPRGWACGRGVATPSGPTGTGTFSWDTDGSYADWYGGHEIGHSQGRGHPSSGNACGHSASDDDYPWADAKIGGEGFRGFDVGGSNAGIQPRVYSNDWHDMMSYCGTPGQWISDYTYVGIKDFSTRSTSRETLRGGALVQLSGLIVPAGHEADVRELRLWTLPGFTPEGPVPGDYRVRFLNASGSELAAYDFTPEEGEGSSALLINEFLPYAPGTVEVQVTHPASGTLGWSYVVSDNAPTVGNVQLSDPTTPVTGSRLLQWSASDDDGDALTYDVLYSANDGQDWRAITLGLESTQVDIDSDELAGSTAGRFRVIANDGFHQGEGVSPAYNVANKAPQITLQNPAAGQSFVFGQQVYFSADVSDLQDGDVADIQWRDQTNFVLGSGTEFSQNDLIIGQNVITISATNSAGLTEEFTFIIFVNDNLAAPGPTLTVGPDQAGWHVADDETALQTATVSISNSGSGALNVSVINDAPWLSVSQSSSVTPLQLTLTADPSAVAPGDFIMTQLLVQGTAAGDTQVLHLPVSLAKGVISLPVGLDLRFSDRFEE